MAPRCCACAPRAADWKFATKKAVSARSAEIICYVFNSILRADATPPSRRLGRMRTSGLYLPPPRFKAKPPARPPAPCAAPWRRRSGSVCLAPGCGWCPAAPRSAAKTRLAQAHAFSGPAGEPGRILPPPLHRPPAGQPYPLRSSHPPVPGRCAPRPGKPRHSPHEPHAPPFPHLGLDAVLGLQLRQEFLGRQLGIQNHALALDRREIARAQLRQVAQPLHQPASEL